MEKNQNSDIQLILNTNGRLNSLTEIFKLLSENHIGRLAKSHYCVKSNVKLNKQESEADVTFNMLQHDAFSKGFSTNCYCINLEI